MTSTVTLWRRKNPKKALAQRKREEAKKTPSSRRANYARNKASGKTHEWDIRTKYGLTVEQYKQLLEKQQGCCAICRTTAWGTRNGRAIRPSVDHCHTTGKVRGLLCLRCNKTIGAFNDDPEMLKKCVSYLTGEDIS